MRESEISFHRHRARAPTVTAAGLPLVLSITSCVSSGDHASGPEDTAGVAVTVQLAGGATVPGIFRGSRDQATEQSGGSFQFQEGTERVSVLHPGAVWFVDDGSAEPVGILASIVYREHGSIVPREFRGPPRLAETVSEAWATERGVTAPPHSIVLELPERHSRVRVIPPGTAVRMIPSS